MQPGKIFAHQPLKRALTFIWYYLFLSILENDVWIFFVKFHLNQMLGVGGLTWV